MNVRIQNLIVSFPYRTTIFFKLIDLLSLTILALKSHLLIDRNHNQRSRDNLKKNEHKGILHANGVGHKAFITLAPV